ncbi:MAG TPA: UTP--glucose-1-phosphate uridylyltransferase GalU [Candidatus Polarisedimenticolia bacterium]|jgi:UTP--glucose-1-phosphate uridylyltransferase|nr:UTP--glucose-1-phosphate uridylyltransferase GalU [Candidatus Polarisedimenticolia bacterium]
MRPSPKSKSAHPAAPPRRPQRIRKAVFPAAGLGTRFLPATKAQPKEMLPLVDKPVIQYVIEEAVASGIDQIVIVTGRGKTAIEDHFDVAFELEAMLEKRGKHELLEEVRSISDLIKVSYVRQKEPLGLGHAILQAKDLVGNEPFAVFLGDDIIYAKVPAMRQMIDVYERCASTVIGVERVARERSRDYGMVAVRPAALGGDGAGRVHEVIDLVEKPAPEDAPSDLAIIGRYILMPEIFRHLEKTAAGSGGEIQLTDGLRSLLREQQIFTWSIVGTRYDTGDKLGFLKATVEYALRREDLGSAFRAYLEGLDIDAIASPGATGPSRRRSR